MAIIYLEKSIFNFKIICFLLFISILISCASKVSKKLQLSEDELFFELTEPLPIKKSFLPNGTYRCYYKDDEGCFFEAPATLKKEMMFALGNTGGIYILDSLPIKAFIYSQDKHPGSAYIQGAGFVTFGGTGYYRVDKPLPDEITISINIQRGNI